MSEKKRVQFTFEAQGLKPTREVFIPDIERGGEPIKVMLDYTPEGQTHHCPLCEQSARKIEQLEKLLRIGMNLQFRTTEMLEWDRLVWCQFPHLSKPKPGCSTGGCCKPPIRCVVCGQPPAFPYAIKEPWTCSTCQAK